MSRENLMTAVEVADSVVLDSKSTHSYTDRKPDDLGLIKNKVAFKRVATHFFDSAIRILIQTDCEQIVARFLVQNIHTGTLVSQQFWHIVFDRGQKLLDILKIDESAHKVNTVLSDLVFFS
jgi:hypothetical protein